MDLKLYQDLKKRLLDERLISAEDEKTQQIIEYRDRNSGLPAALTDALKRDLDAYNELIGRKYKLRYYQILALLFTEQFFKDKQSKKLAQNALAYWMATGSGKSIVLIKLIELLQDLMKNETIPQNEILFLTHRPDLIDQLKAHIIEFNQYTKREKGIEFIVRDLKEFPEQKIQGNLFKDSQINIYFYRSDLVSDIQKENIIDFKNYDNDGKWYVILDEAHKGDSEESKRKQYFNILSRNGFLFNFSATFTDEIDILSTVYNLNLAEYIKKGFGKHLYLFREQFKNFKKTVDEKDFEQEELSLIHI